MSMVDIEWREANPSEKQAGWTWPLVMENFRLPSRGELREGTVLAMQPDALLVDIGTKRDAIVPPYDLRQVDTEYREALHVGDTVWVRVLRPLSSSDELTVSLRQGLAQRVWVRAERLLESGEIFEAPVIGYNSGGVLVRFDKHEVFVPNSHCARLPRGLTGEAKEAAKAELIGETLTLCFLEVNRRRHRMVASERAAQRKAARALMAQLEPGQVRKGTVTGLAKFGAFVDIGGVEGMVHVSELAHHFVHDPAEELAVGDVLEVEVLNTDVERGRISLSRRRLLPKPGEWDNDLGVN